MPQNNLNPEVTAFNESRRNRHRLDVVAAVMSVLFLYLYTFTFIPAWLHLPSSQTLMESAGLKFDHVWNGAQVVESHLAVNKLGGWDSSQEKFILLMLLSGAFISAYFLPIRYKKVSMVVWFLFGLLIFFGIPAMFSFLGMHLFIYMLFHGRQKFTWLVALAVGGIFGFYIPQLFFLSVTTSILSAGVGMCAAYLLWVFCSNPLFDCKRGIDVFRLLIIQSPMIVAICGALFEEARGWEWKLPLGILLFFWQWMRLMVYHQDFKEGLIPKNLPLSEYLSIFMTPAILANWTYAPYTGQGYSYLAKRYLCDDKNKIVMAGVRLFLLAFVYLVFADWIVVKTIGALEHRMGVVVYPYTTHLVRAFHDGIAVRPVTVLLTTMFDQFRVFLVFGGILHFRVATWRILGYNVEPQYNSFWMATNLVSLWQRFSYHFREFLVRCFYYPVFFKFFKEKLILRVFVATFAAAGLGNYLWGHIPDRLYDKGITFEFLISILRRWPYFLLLGLGISLTQLYLMRKGRTRKPWTWDRRLPLDVACAYLTFQYFSLIHIFARPHPEGSLGESLRLFLRAFGIH